MQRKLTTSDIKNILRKIKYKDWQLRIIEKGEDVVLLQWIFYAVDNDNPSATELEPQFCRKWYISLYSTDSEIIRSAYLAVQQAEMHELSENFTFEGARLFDPHIDLIALKDANIGQDSREPLELVNS